LAEAWDGTSWRIERSANPNSSTGTGLSGVSCTAANACSAVGYCTNTAGTQLNLAEAWDGTTWKIQRIPTSRRSADSVLTAILCPAARACSAVGNYLKPTLYPVTLAEVWDGTSWSIQATPTPAGAENSGLWAVSCSAANACTAVGFDDARAPPRCGTVATLKTSASSGASGRPMRAGSASWRRPSVARTCA
jgi:hypothetical protein